MRRAAYTMYWRTPPLPPIGSPRMPPMRIWKSVLVLLLLIGHLAGSALFVVCREADGSRVLELRNRDCCETVENSSHEMVAGVDAVAAEECCAGCVDNSLLLPGVPERAAVHLFLLHALNTSPFVLDMPALVALSHAHITPVAPPDPFLDAHRTVVLTV